MWWWWRFWQCAAPEVGRARCKHVRAHRAATPIELALRRFLRKFVNIAGSRISEMFGLGDGVFCADLINCAWFECICVEILFCVYENYIYEEKSYFYGCWVFYAFFVVSCLGMALSFGFFTCESLVLIIGRLIAWHPEAIFSLICVRLVIICRFLLIYLHE